MRKIRITAAGFLCLIPARAPAETSLEHLNGPAFIAAGDFWMGSPDGEGNTDEHPRHRVYVDAFRIDRYEVTVGRYKKCVEAGQCSASKTASARGTFGWKLGVGCNWGNPKRNEDYPANCIDWSQADSYCRWAGKRLPTEAEWEKAARGGTDTRYSFGNDESALRDYAWYRDDPSGDGRSARHIAARYFHIRAYLDDYGGLTRPAGGKKPNQFGLYDMSGNVWEWTSDWYDGKYYETSPGKNPRGPADGGKRVIRGGAWSHSAGSCRPARRWKMSPDIWYDIIGFRCVSRGGQARQRLRGN